MPNNRPPRRPTPPPRGKPFGRDTGAPLDRAMTTELPASTDQAPPGTDTVGTVDNFASVVFDVTPEILLALPAPGGSAIVGVSLERSGPGTASTLCLGAFFLKPGQLTPAQFAAGFGRLTVAGVEVPYAGEAYAVPHTLHPDGSLRMVHVQVTRTLTNGTPVTAVLDCAATRNPAGMVADTTAAIESVSGSATPTSQYNEGVQGSVLTTDPAQACDSGMFGFTRPASEDDSDLTFLPDVLALYATKEATVARLSLPNNFATRYERADGYACMYARTGNAAYWHRAVAQYCQWRAVIMAPNGYFTAEYYVECRTWTLMYFCLRDPGALLALHKWATLAAPTTNSPWLIMGTQTNNGVGRAAARAGQAAVFLTRVAPDLGSYWDNSIKFDSATMTSLISRAMNEPGVAMLWPEFPPAWVDTLDGGDPVQYPTIPTGTGVIVPSDGFHTLAIQYFGQNGGVDGRPSIPYHFTFQAAIFMADFAIEYWEKVEHRASILTRVRQIAAYWWAKCRYSYGSGYTGERLTYTNFANYAGGYPAADLNGWPRRVMYWLAWQEALLGNLTAATLWVGRGDALVHALLGYGDGADGPFLDNAGNTSKQFDENFHTLPGDLGLRHRAKALGA